MERPEKLLDIKSFLAQPWHQVVYSLLGNSLERLLGVQKLNRFYQLCQQDVASPGEFAERVFELMGVHYVLPEKEIDALKAEKGPMLVVCNHPFGGIEALFLVLFLSKIRPDFRIIANYFLGYVPEVKEHLILVDPFGQDGSRQFNVAPIRAALSYLEQGGLLGIFPSGEVASLSLRSGKIQEPPWHPLVGRLALQSRATVVPLYFHGTNSLIFHLAGLVNPRLRTGLLIREFLNPRFKKIRYLVGKPQRYEKLQRFETPERVTHYLRSKTYLLGERYRKHQKRLRFRLVKKIFPRGSTSIQPIAPALASEMLYKALCALPPKQKLLENKEIEVYYFRGQQALPLLEEIGRLRELTFRSAGEGTGKSRDLDSYDLYYDHLVLWHKSEARIIGAYRMGRIDQILHEKGPKGLYLFSLFRLSPRIFKEILPALELGRAFVVEEHQKSYGSLYHLWQGIGHYILLHPHYRYLIGAVSMSDEFTDFSKSLLIAFLKEHFSAPELSAQVQPRAPYRVDPDYQAYYSTLSVTSLQDVQDLIEEIEGGHLKLPTLIKHYLKMGAKILAFNIDKEFSNVLDVLMVTDLLQAPASSMERYMGKEGYQRYLSYFRS
ncbi:MAG: lysophospholipid acyltransferase family protein [Bacteroidia bacterium]